MQGIKIHPNLLNVSIVGFPEWVFLTLLFNTLTETKQPTKEPEKPKGVFCTSDNASGYFPESIAREQWWQDQSGFKPAEEPKKPETPITTAPTTKPTKEKQ